MLKFRQQFILLLTCLCFTDYVHSQSQDIFYEKYAAVSMAASDPKKALAMAKDLYNQMEQNKTWQTYGNYYIMKTLFETTVKDEALAKKCGDKATKIMNDMVGIVTTDTVTGQYEGDVWDKKYFPALFSTKDPNNAIDAEAYLKTNAGKQNYTNYCFLGYAFERNGDYIKAREYYEKAMQLPEDDKTVYHSYSYYAGFLARTGDYLKAEELIARMEKLSKDASEYLRTGYHSESIAAKSVYYLAIGDYQSYVKSSEEQYKFMEQVYSTNKIPCPSYDHINKTLTAFGFEMLKQYDKAEIFWKKRDSSFMVWYNCIRTTYPNMKMDPISMYPAFMAKRGKSNKLPKPLSFYIAETEKYYNGIRDYADISTNVEEARQLAYLGSPRYPAMYQPILEDIRKNHNLRESTVPFADFAYFSMRDRKWEDARKLYKEMFTLNHDWINDIIFTFGEKAFVTYFNAKLREGYNNFHSLVKLAKQDKPDLFSELAAQGYDNLLLTKSISLRGTEKRKEAFLKNNDPAIEKLYNDWLVQKQQLIRQYMKLDDSPVKDSSKSPDAETLRRMQENVDRMENELTKGSHDFRKYLQIETPSWESVRDKLREGEAAIEMVRFTWRDKVYLSDSSYYAAYIIRHNSTAPEVVYLPDQADALDRNWYKNYKNLISTKRPDAESYNHFWKPIHDKLQGINRVYFSPDGIYHLINLSTLMNPDTKQFVLDETEIYYTTSASDLLNRQPASGDSKLAVLFGRPLYKTGVVPDVPVTGDKTRSLVSGFKNNNIDDLPGTETEVLTIKTELEQSKTPVQVFIRNEATEDKIYQLHSPDILHIATHGYWSPSGNNATDGYRLFNAMARSGLLLSGVVDYYASGSYPETYDGILTAYEAENLDLQHTTLVVLSACETSLGYLDAGEGVYGLQRAFRVAGASSIMTSLWKVNDQATRDFMISFYAEYMKSHDQAKAFRVAQKTTKDKWKEPYFWGAFVLTGEHKD